MPTVSLHLQRLLGSREIEEPYDCGSWKITEGKKGTAPEFKVSGTVDAPLPGLMKMVVVPVVSSEFEKLVEKYIDNLIKKFGREV